MYTGLFDRFLGHAVRGSALQTYKSLSGSAYRPLVPFSVSLILLKYEYGLKMSEGEIMLLCQQPRHTVILVFRRGNLNTTSGGL